jgi:hypothetical protein
MTRRETRNVWHFSDGTLSYDRNDKVVAGLSLACNPDDIRLCQYGFHGSYDILGALQYANGSVLSYCEIGGRIIKDDDKVVASIRRHIIVVDIERTLHEFAIWCAEQALALIDNSDERSVNVLKIKRLWLDGKATDEELTAARDAAWDVARDVARDAARDAARAAARAAARTATWTAARDAAWDAARTAARASAWDAARDAARDAQNDKLTTMILGLPEFQAIKTGEQS